MPLKRKSARDSLRPAGKQFDQAYAEDLAQEEELVLSVVITRAMMNALRPW